MQEDEGSKEGRKEWNKEGTTGKGKKGDAIDTLFN